MKTEKEKQHIRFPLLILALAGTVLAATGITAARYLMEKNREGIVEAEDFYFTSDLLKENQEHAMYFIDPESKSFRIKLHNFADSLRITPGSVDYKVTVLTAGSSSEPSYGTLSSTDGSQVTETLIITPDSNAPAASDITVTAESTSPYAKVLNATFKRECGNQYIVSDEAGNRAATLTMVCADSAKEITLNLPDGVIPDATDGRVSSFTDKTAVFQSPGEGVYSLILLKSSASKVLKTSEGSSEGKFADTITITD